MFLDMRISKSKINLPIPNLPVIIPVSIEVAFQSRESVEARRTNARIPPPRPLLLAFVRRRILCEIASAISFKMGSR